MSSYGGRALTDGVPDAIQVQRKDRPGGQNRVVDQLSGHGADNVGVFEDNGSPRKLHPLLLDPSPGRASLHIAGFALTGDDLYIANSWRKDSHIALYHRHGAIRSLARPIMLSE